MNKLLLLMGAVLAVVGCQVKPTKMTAEESVQTTAVTAETLMQGQPVLLDARPSFEFNLSHVPGAINVRWEDFSQSSPLSRGVLQNDLFAVARRLSLVGIDPDTKVLVLGKGRQGNGEEGRVAWTLKVLGVKNVYTVVHSSFRGMNPDPTKAGPEIKNKPYWKPSVNEALAITAKDFKKQVTQEKPKALVLDVRSAEEFNLRNLSKEKGVKAQVVNIEWKDFFDDKGLPTLKAVEARLQQQGLTKDAQILVVSTHGVRSGAVTYALQSLGYNKVQNFAGGYEQWK